MTALVMCMAGRYRRFADAGYTAPKFLLPFRGRTILGHVAAHLPSERTVLVANERDREHEASIRDAVPGAVLHWTPDTDGQAETAAIGARLCVARGWTGPIVFHNVDTIVEGRDLAAIGERLRRADGLIDVFPETSPAFSYVRVDEDERVVEIAEKVPISPWATTGLYGFASPAAYLDWMARVQPAGGAGVPPDGGAGVPPAQREFYVSAVYAAILEAGGLVVAPRPEPHHRTVVLGTPAQYEAANP